MQLSRPGNTWGIFIPRITRTMDLRRKRNRRKNNYRKKSKRKSKRLSMRIRNLKIRRKSNTGKSAGINMILGLSDEIKFGKHKGELIRDIIQNDPEYLDWAISNGIIEVDKEAQHLISEEFD